MQGLGYLLPGYRSGVYLNSWQGSSGQAARPPEKVHAALTSDVPPVDPAWTSGRLAGGSASPGRAVTSRCCRTGFPLWCTEMPGALQDMAVPGSRVIGYQAIFGAFARFGVAGDIQRSVFAVAWKNRPMRVLVLPFAAVDGGGVAGFVPGELDAEFLVCPRMTAAMAVSGFSALPLGRFRVPSANPVPLEY